MYIQQRYLKDSEAFASSTTGLETVKLPNKGYLSGLELRIWGTNGTTAGSPDVWLRDRLLKVEVICNGSRVVKSFEGNQILADMLYKGCPINSHDVKNLSGGSAEEFFYLNFGRFYHDPEYMLDLGQVNDPELRIDYSFGLTSQNGWTNGVAMASAPSYSLIPHIVRDMDVPPKGYIKTSEVYRFTGSASKKENMTVPRGPRYANMYVQSWYKANGIGYNLDKLELNMNNDAVIPFRVGPTELAAETIRKYGLFHFFEQLPLTGGQQYPFPLEQSVILMFQLGVVGYIPTYVDIWGNAGAPGFRDQATGLTPYTGNLNIGYTLVGTWPFSVAPLPIFDLMDERTWIDSSLLGDLWVRYEGNSSMSSSAVIKLLADEVVTSYPGL